MDPLSVYLHIPFCLSRCSYCDFFTCANRIKDIARYCQSLCNEIETRVDGTADPLFVHSIYFGGGTPTLIPLDSFKNIFQALRRNFVFHDGIEITVEGNPGSIRLEYLKSLANLGINRLSFGMQSGDQNELRLLGRHHSPTDVRGAVELARLAGFNNLSLDLIYGIPSQTLMSWKKTLQMAIDLNVEHLSLYALTLEENTPLTRKIFKGLCPKPDDDLAADMYEEAEKILEKAGFELYEISNWAKRDGEGTLKSSKHNLQYWYNLPYLGFGAGAHGYANGFRSENIKDIDEYIQRVDGKGEGYFPFGRAVERVVPITPLEEMRETMMVGLRLTMEGVSKERFNNRFGKNLSEIFQNEIDNLIEVGLLEWGGGQGEHLRLTRRGRLLGNRVFMRFLGEGED